MLYLTDNEGLLKIVILEKQNVEEILKGHPAQTPDKSVLIAWTPDPVWLADKLMDCDGGDAAKIAALIDEAAKRPQQPVNRPKHGHHVHKFGARK